MQAYTRHTTNPKHNPQSKSKTECVGRVNASTPAQSASVQESMHDSTDEIAGTCNGFAARMGPTYSRLSPLPFKATKRGEKEHSVGELIGDKEEKGRRTALGLYYSPISLLRPCGAPWGGALGRGWSTASEQSATAIGAVRDCWRRGP